MVKFNEFGQGYFYFSELDKSAGSMSYVPSTKKLHFAKHLTDTEYAILCNVNMMHQRSWGLSERDKYSLSHVKKIVVAVPDRIIKVYYKCGDWYHYTKEGRWY